MRLLNTYCQLETIFKYDTHFSTLLRMRSVCQRAYSKTYSIGLKDILPLH